ncbi:amidohydrolase family protein [Mycobacterium ulcerans]|nr:amidohydrolase family protein [Mycobacterium ulcerans]MEB3971256.1 amidohydrolase family protein [Mycobacterium ulcerans]MEB3979523.1 amidohydrolase family protein [Mycobacterium ulcerans]MEB4008785.1 amidohydrolase family protein [Mycobacterium ulcerans]MEB4417867.1 amidohydrolase family protein [Mycobacterium ulcerans]MEB4436515.1 amidohydrolase family protein [Mycobacterium ulcerans]
MDRYTVISADCHAGADLFDYREYLEAKYQDEFDDWAKTFVNPFGDLSEPDAEHNWDSDRRNAELDSDGVAGEVIFPNTVPPFFPQGSLAAPPPSTARDLELRWAGLRAHNRWLADFCSLSPERRAGVGQILLGDVDEAVAEVAQIAKLGLPGGVLLPGVAPGTGIPALYAEHWEPLWAACAQAGLVINHHGGNAGPSPIDGWGSSLAVLVYESHWWAHRALLHLIFSGVLDRYPDLTVVLTEQGTGWIPATLDSLDVAAARYRRPNSAIARFAGPTAGSLPLQPSQYWARQCYVGASFLRPVECAQRHRIGVDRIMWASDYPHMEGTAPYSREALRHTFSDVDPDEVAAMVGGNAAAVYGFDLQALAPLAARIGPTVTEVAEPLAAIPADASSTAFEPDPIRAW